jgi:hypothetical protein
MLILISWTSSRAAAAVQVGVGWIRCRVLVRHGRWRGRRLVAAIVHNAGEQILASTRKGVDSVLGRLVLAGTRCQWSLMVMGWEAGRWERWLDVRMRRGARAVVAVRVAASTKRLREYVCNWRKTVVCLLCRNMVDVRGLRQVGRGVCELSRGWHTAESSERLVDRGGLNHSLVGKLGVRRRGDAETWRRALSPRRVGRLHGPSKRTLLLSGSVIVQSTAFASVLLACFNDLSLALSDVHALVKLLTHRGVVGVEARRQAGKAHVVGSEGGCGAGGECARGVDYVGAGEIETAWAMTGDGGIGRRGLFLDDNLGCGATRPARRLAVR